MTPQLQTPHVREVATRANEVAARASEATTRANEATARTAGDAVGGNAINGDAVACAACETNPVTAARLECIYTTRELQARADALRAAGRRVALVPTMGALHAGHMALVDAARAPRARGGGGADFVVLSIYVNPAQFDAAADLAAYPRTLAADLARCEAHFVDAVFLPRDAELYPRGAQTWVEVSELSQPLEGRARPGHFRGVATVVTKLLLAAKPQVAMFGEKDFQQLALLRRLVRDLGFDTEVLGVPTAREPDGLALSSRNARLTSAARAQAVVLSRALDAVEAAFAHGERRAHTLAQTARAELTSAPLARVEYVELCAPDTLEIFDAQSASPSPSPRRVGEVSEPALLALAVVFPGAKGVPVRLIDNRVLRRR